MEAATFCRTPLVGVFLCLGIASRSSAACLLQMAQSDINQRQQFIDGQCRALEVSLGGYPRLLNIQ